MACNFIIRNLHYFNLFKKNMIPRKILLSMIILSGAYSINSNAQSPSKSIPLIPLPYEMQSGQGAFIIDSLTTINYTEDDNVSDINIFIDYINTKYGILLTAKKSSAQNKQQINIKNSSDLESDAYRLKIDSAEILIEAGKNAGVFYALQTLKQLLPDSVAKVLIVPQVVIDDKPRFKYRGMHLDVARHFFNVDAVKKYIDYLAMYKMNYFHWHLTDDQGWRIEIKKYPLLQTISASRKNTLIGHLGDQPENYDSVLYEGYYTQQEIKNIVEYAAKRHITIVPEIEMPGHALAALAAYPEYSCTGGPFEVGKTWGVFKDVFCPKEETFVFIQNVLDEVCELFPGKYIHIGGDECPKDRWKNCSSCQEFIKKENLGDENGLQSYFTNRIVSYLKKKNKTAIGWDEILEKDIDSDAIIMSWRGYKGGVDAAIKGHDVIMSPASHCYFDMYQSRFSDGRIAIGGYLPVEQVYGFEPVPDVLNESQAQHIIGAQGNVWTEYITNEERLQEMIFPRMAALAEVLWSPNEKRDFKNFSSRLVTHFKLLEFSNLKYSTALYDINSRVTPNGKNGIYLELFSNYANGQIYYTLNAAEPSKNYTPFTEKILIDHSLAIQAFVFEDEKIKGKIFSQVFDVNKATGKEVVLVNQPHQEYSRGGAFSLVDGVTGNLPWIPSEWLGFSGKDLDATIDLDSLQTVSNVVVDVLKDEAGKIFLPKEITVFVSINGIDYKLAGKLDSANIDSKSRKLSVSFPEIPTRWIKVIVKNVNDKDWLFVDEIIIE